MKPNEYVMIQGKAWPCDTDTQQKIAARELSRVGYNSTRLWRDGVSTERLLLADTNVDPVVNGTAPGAIDACQRLIQAHAADVRLNMGADTPQWKVRHVGAWCTPIRSSDVGVKQALQAFACFVDAYSAEFSGSKLGEDGYFGEHAADMLKAVHAWLTMGNGGKLESGAISRLIGQLARAAGIDPDNV